MQIENPYFIDHPEGFFEQFPLKNDAFFGIIHKINRTHNQWLEHSITLQHCRLFFRLKRYFSGRSLNSEEVFPVNPLKKWVCHESFNIIFSSLTSFRQVRQYLFPCPYSLGWISFKQAFYEIFSFRRNILRF